MTQFPSPPGEALIQSFQEHVRRTGQPETFPGITTTKPPKDGAVVALYHPIRIARATRPRGDMAPCPICSPSSPKYLDGGTLIWCEGSHAIYAVGPDCSSTLWADGRLNRAVNALRQTNKEKADLEALAAAVASVAAHLHWIEGHRKPAELADRYHGNLERAAPTLRSGLSRYARTSSVNDLRGRDFLRGAWHLERKLTDAQLLWAGLEKDLADVELAALAPSVVQERLRIVARARKAIKHVADRLSATAGFLSDANARGLVALGRSGRTSISFKGEVAGNSLTLRSLGEVWVAPIGVAEPRSLP